MAEHLRYFAELGVEGISTDPAWRERREPAGAVSPPPDAGAARPETVEYDQSAVTDMPEFDAEPSPTTAAPPSGGLAAIRADPLADVAPSGGGTDADAGDYLQD